MTKFVLFLFSTGFCFFSTHAQPISTIAGTGTAASTGDGGLALSATFNNPAGAYYDAVGNIYVAEYSGNKIRKINTVGVVSTFAGNGVFGYGGDGGPATAASFKYPIDIIDDPSGNVYIVDNTNHRIRKVNTAGTISTIAGNGIAGYSGDGGPATAASLNHPNRITLDASGNLFIVDAVNNVIRKVNTLGIITTVAGNGIAGFSGDGGPATAAKLSRPLGVAFDVNANMYIADGFNRRIRKVSPSGIISTIAGTGTAGTGGDGGPAIAATMDYPNGVAVDLSCNVYFTDWNTHKVRRINTSGVITTVVGTGVAGFSGDGGPAVLATMNGPDNLTFDAGMNLYIPDFYNNRIRKVTNLGETSVCPSTIPIPSIVVSGTIVCQDSCITVTSTSTGAIDSVRWITIPAGALIANQTASISTICFPASGSVIVRLKVYGTGTIDSSSIIVSVNPAPHPIITKSGYVLSVSSGSYSSYQWYNGSAAIVGATSSSYTYSAIANYRVVVDSSGCKGTSNAINTTGIATIPGHQNSFRMHQTSSNSFTLQSAYPLIESMKMDILDLSGRVHISFDWNEGSTSKEINNLTLTGGLYIVKLTGAQTSVTFRWVQY